MLERAFKGKKRRRSGSDAVWVLRVTGKDAGLLWILRAYHWTWASTSLGP